MIQAFSAVRKWRSSLSTSSLSTKSPKARRFSKGCRRGRDAADCAARLPPSWRLAAAMSFEHGAGDIAPARRGEKGDRFGDILRPPKSADGNGPPGRLDLLRRKISAHGGRIGQARRDRVD